MVRKLRVASVCSSISGVKPQLTGHHLYTSSPTPNINQCHMSVQRWMHTTLPVLDSSTVNCPPFAESITEGDVRWEKAVGDSVEEDETVGEIETDKTKTCFFPRSSRRIRIYSISGRFRGDRGESESTP